MYDANKSYSLNEALEILKKITTTKFDASVEAHFRLG
ncbi:50S ribosomal protein L1, partial [Candidatus Falkowbacteria bacterium]|nr:50S ribosomal protein L1 [Candidatus Falkowbacteria bacterium]